MSILISKASKGRCYPCMINKSMRNVDIGRYITDWFGSTDSLESYYTLVTDLCSVVHIGHRKSWMMPVCRKHLQIAIKVIEEADENN